MASSGQRHDRNALILYGSETGNAQDIAEELGRTAERLRFSTRVSELDAIGLNEMLHYQVVMFAISTTGQGDFPTNARLFWRKMRNARLEPGCLSRLQFTTFGLGDSSYPQYNWAHRKLHNRLRQLGAELVHARGESDEQDPEGVDGIFVPWCAQLKQALLKKFPLPPDIRPLPDEHFLVPKWVLETYASQTSDGVLQNSLHLDIASAAPRAPTKGHQMLTASLVSNSRVTPVDHWQDVRLLEFSTPPIDYSPGDVLTIFPHNSPEDVQHLLELMDWTDVADRCCHFRMTDSTSASTYLQPPPLESRTSTLRQILTTSIDINAIPRRSFFAKIAHFTSDEMQRERLIEFTNPEYLDELYDYTTRPRRSILEVLQEFHTVKIPFKWLADIFPIIKGRQFSIASGGSLKYDKDGNGRIELLVAIVKYRTVIKRIREGLCTRYLASLTPGAKLEVLFCEGSISHAAGRPALMIGPGTGVAPLRSMIYERVIARSSKSDPLSQSTAVDTFLFFGGRNRQADFFFELEWQSLSEQMGLEVLPAFSRDQKSKVYVQDVIRRNGPAVYRTLRNGDVYVCGSSGNMPKAVREALIDILEEHGDTSRSAAETFLASMEKDGRYQQETW